MGVYLMCFGASCLFLKISDKFKKNKIAKILIISIALLIPCILAGLRHYSIGTDIEIYVRRLFQCAKSADGFIGYLKMHWFYIWENRYVYDYEIGFTTLVYVIAKIIGNLQWVLFFIHILIVVPIYLGLRKFKDLDGKLWLCMLVFYFMFYNVSLNIVRQYIAIAILFYGISSLLNDKRGETKFWISLIVALLFHNSSLLGIVVYILYSAIYKENKFVIRISKHTISKNKIILFGVILFGIVIIMNPNIVIKILNILNIDHYSGYVNGEVSLTRSSIIKALPVLIWIFLVGKRFVLENKDGYFLLSMFVFDFFISQFASVNPYASRIGYLFFIFNIVLFPKLCSSFKKKENNLLMMTTMIGYVLFYWYYIFVFYGTSQTVPYIMYK